MEYISFPVISCRLPAVIQCTPAQRWTWFCLCCYCGQMENGGTIHNCKNWSEDVWRTAIGVFIQDVKDSTDLWKWRGSDLLIEHYPLKGELYYHMKRNAASKGGKSRSEKKIRSSRENGSVYRVNGNH